MAPKTKFVEGEKVLCFHGPVIYEAKVIDVQTKNKEILYQVHYSGWNKNWDEWVDETRILKHNEAGLQKQKELKSAFSKSNARKMKAGPQKSAVTPPEAKPPEIAVKPEKEPAPGSLTPSTEKPSRKPKPEQTTPADKPALKHKTTDVTTPGDSSRRKKPKIETAVETEEQYLSKTEVKVKLPDALKPLLVDDWDMINRQKMLVQLPAKKSIDKILDEYYQSKVAKEKECRDTVLEITKGIRDYFVTMLGTQLLYKFERTQYGDYVKENPQQSLTEVYGSVHLLRLFVKLGNMLAHTNLDEKAMSVLLSHIQDFLRWMVKNISTLFHPSDYYIAPPDYHRKALV